ncbi:MAG: site-specific integrase [Lentisphaerae bacterium]|nr:site-specific integrase [Lentisphaerota bacterium]
MKRVRIARNLILADGVVKCRIKRQNKFMEWTSPYQGDRAYSMRAGVMVPKPALLKWLANVETALAEKRWEALTSTHIRRGTVSISKLIDVYEAAAARRRAVAGTPTERSTRLVVQRVRQIARAAGVAENETIDKLTPETIDKWIAKRVLDQTTSDRPREKALAVAADLLNSARGIFARWALEEYRRQGIEIPDCVLRWPRPATSWRPQWQDPPRELKLKTLAEAMVLRQTQPKVWILFHVILSFGCRPNDALNLRLSDFQMMPGANGMRRCLVYRPNKTQNRNAKTVTIPVPDRVWRELLEARSSAGCGDELVVPSIPGHRGRQQVQEELNKWMRSIGWSRQHFYAGAYNLRKLFTSAVLVAAGEQAASDYCGSSIAMVRRHYGAFYTERLPEIDAAAVMRG